MLSTFSWLSTAARSRLMRTIANISIYVYNVWNRNHAIYIYRTSSSSSSSFDRMTLNNFYYFPYDYPEALYINVVDCTASIRISTHANLHAHQMDTPGIAIWNYTYTYIYTALKEQFSCTRSANGIVTKHQTQKSHALFVAAAVDDWLTVNPLIYCVKYQSRSTKSKHWDFPEQPFMASNTSYVLASSKFCVGFWEICVCDVIYANGKNVFNICGGCCESCIMLIRLCIFGDCRHVWWSKACLFSTLSQRRGM